jgi:succinate dehydrogenase / fumarate reductase cytochrome b subunit
MHMYGNLKAFAGAESFNTYAHHLRTLGEPILPYEGFLWIFRLVMLGALVVHVASAASLWRRANGARSSRYVVKKAKAATLSSKWMRWGGITLLAFIIFHLLQFTTNTIRVNGDHAEPYQRMVAGLIALASLGMHLRHGVWSACQTLGLVGNAQAKKTVNTIAILVAVVVALGFAAVPLAVLGGLIS